MSIQFIKPDWPQPDSVHAIVTTRQGGKSLAPYESLNLAQHVSDNYKLVTQNRESIAHEIGADDKEFQWQWLEQIHSSDVVKLEHQVAVPKADGLVTSASKLICCVLTADCLPVLFCNEKGTEVAIAHGGWRGLANGIIANTLASMESHPSTLMAWLGPAIGPCHFEVGEDVRLQFQAAESDSTVLDYFAPQGSQKYLADLYGIARMQLNKLGVKRVFGGEHCTFCDVQNFYSYRRDGVTGRMLSSIWLDPTSLS